MSLRITVELLKYGDPRQASTLGTVLVHNKGPVDGFPPLYNYEGVLYQLKDDKFATGVYVPFRHARADGWAMCAAKALLAVGPMARKEET